MSYQVEGTLYIDMAEFWEWVNKRFPLPEAESVMGKPRFNGNLLEIDFAADNESDPRNWTPKPKCMGQWEDELA